jgi:hypothetical protein
MVAALAKSEEARETAEAEIERMTPKFVAYEYLEAQDAGEASVSQALNELSCCDDIPLNRGLAAGISALQSDRETLRSSLSQALARIEELEKALKPFADLGVPSSDKWECGTFLIGHNDIRSAYRAAAKALPTTPIDGGKG